MKVDYSIVIPTYNRGAQLLLTLAAFELQTFPRHRFEIIIVDDGSTDDTCRLLQGYNAPYALQLIAEKRRSGPARARNRGIKAARGSRIIFCDADYLVRPDFIEIHHRCHVRKPKTAFSGVPYCYERVYTRYFPDFSPWEKKQMQRVLERTGLWQERFLADNKAIDIFTPAELRRDFSIVNGVRGGNLLPAALKKEFLRTDVAPWLLFITRCVSVEKEYLEQAGGFNERLVRGAGEDWELGYRLHRLGVAFRSIPRVTGFHQEHPHSYRTPDRNFIPFYCVLQEEFGCTDPELLLLSLWESSDDLWRELPAYKNALRLLQKKEFRSPRVKDVAALLLKACRRLAGEPAERNG
ncbi:MAG: glycosyltransferase [Firmicutes bacterium]|nr:glycosyltransferase [Bacillota bacterium]